MTGCRIAVVNTGASTLKLALVDVGADAIRSLQRIQRDWQPGGDPAESLRAALGELEQAPDAFGHRVVHGGSGFSHPTLLDDDVERELEALIPLAPLHNGPAVAGIRETRHRYPQIPAVAVFDTAFHTDRAPASMRYALPADLVEAFGFRRFGFHGIAHQSLLESLAAAQDRPVDEVSAVTLQLGAGCSACAIRRGRSIETSMGFTPLEGLVMATRCGDIDPAIVLRLIESGYTVEEVEKDLNRRSGLKALCGRRDMREIVDAAAAGFSDAELAIELFCRRIVLAVGAYFTLLDGDGALVFGGGIGTHSADVRVRVAQGLTAWGISLDPALNRGNKPGRISADATRPVFVFRTDEESVIARAVAKRLASE